jgi:hypothetical protein
MNATKESNNLINETGKGKDEKDTTWGDNKSL